jgi:hypothetical protein
LVVEQADPVLAAGGVPIWRASPMPSEIRRATIADTDNGVLALVWSRDGSWTFRDKATGEVVATLQRYTDLVDDEVPAERLVFGSRKAEHRSGEKVQTHARARSAREVRDDQAAQLSFLDGDMQIKMTQLALF